jgi:tetratricopeptide (TPR) repeat protein
MFPRLSRMRTLRMLRTNPGTAARRLAVAAFALACITAGTAQASERGRAERLYTKGLAELQAGHTDAALALFQQSVEADPKDVHGLYYRGVGFGRAGRYEEAVADLKQVVAASDPSLERDRLELGYALYRLERYEEAAAELEIASNKAAASSSEALLLLGIVEIRRGHYDAATTALKKAENQDATKAVPSRYYQGLAAYREGNNDEATVQFVWVSEQGGDSPYVRESSAFLASLRDGGARRYSVRGGLAFEYDSNVALAPDNDNVAQNIYGISGEDDGRAVLTAGGKYALVSTPTLRMAVGYDFLASLHFDLERFDVQTHRIGTDTQYVYGPLTFGFATAYEFSMLNEESLLHGGAVLPWLRIDEGSFGRTEIYYRMRARNFLEDSFSPVRDSVNHATGARQFFSLGAYDRNVIIGYRFDADRAERTIGDQYDYNGSQFEGGIEWGFSPDLWADLIYAYKLENYSEASSNRDDDEHQVIARVQKKICAYTWLTASYIFHRNISDQVSFDYTRHITSLGVEVRY